MRLKLYSRYSDFYMHRRPIKTSISIGWTRASAPFRIWYRVISEKKTREPRCWLTVAAMRRHRSLDYDYPDSMGWQCFRTPPQLGK